MLYFLQLFNKGDQILTLMIIKDITMPVIYVSPEYLDLCHIYITEFSYISKYCQSYNQNQSDIFLA